MSKQEIAVLDKLINGANTAIKKASEAVIKTKSLNVLISEIRELRDMARDRYLEISDHDPWQYEIQLY